MTLAALAVVLFAFMPPGIDQAIRSGLLISVSAVLSAINFRTGIIPDRITLPVLAVGLLTSLVTEHPGPANALLGVVVGGGMVLALTVVMRGRIGGGVTKMGAMVGAFLGWPLTIPFLACSFLTTVVAVPVAMWLGFKQPRTSRGLAPYLGMSATVSLLVGDRLLQWWLR